MTRRPWSAALREAPKRSLHSWVQPAIAPRFLERLVRGPARPEAHVPLDRGDAREVCGQLAPLQETALLREVREALEPRDEDVGVGQAAHELGGACGLQQELLPVGFHVGLRGRSQRLEVALVHEGASQAPQRRAIAPGAYALEGYLLVEGFEQHVVAPGEALGQPLLPGLGEHDVGFRLVRHAEAGHHPALERPLLKDGRTESVDRGDLGSLQHLEGGRAAIALAGGHASIGTRPLEALAQAQLHGGGRVLGEGDGRDLVEACVAAADEPLDAVHKEGRLARARPRLQHQARGVVGPRPLPRLFVLRPEAPAHSQSRRRRARFRFGSAVFLERRRSMRPFGPHAALKSQKSQDVGSCAKIPLPHDAQHLLEELPEVVARDACEVEGDLPAAVHVVEEGLGDALAGEEALRGQDVEGDLELLSSTEDAAVVARGLAGLVVPQEEGAVGPLVDAVDLAR